MKPCVLLVDDNSVLLRAFKNFLVPKGYDVEAAHSAAEALRKLDDNIFDLVITDMRMETNTAGFTVAESAKRQSYMPAVAIFSAFPLRAADWQGIADALFLKGTANDDLICAIEDLCRRPRKTSA